ncbi:MAG: sugar-binding domain-containing protein [Melioribacteraceae bacterium]
MKKLFVLFTMLVFAIPIMGQKISLDGDWGFLKNQNNTIAFEVASLQNGWQTIEVPSNWHLAIDNLIDYQGYAYYKKIVNINIPEEPKRIILHFDAVDYLSKLYINKKYVGSHEGGFTPFYFDITNYIMNGENEILLSVLDPNDSTNIEGIYYRNIPHGKQSWYTQNSGIWQSVYITTEPILFIRNSHITRSLNGEFSFQTNLDSKVKISSSPYLLIIKNKLGNKVFEKSGKADIKNGSFTISGSIVNPILWDLENPYLYSFEMKVGESVYEEKFGFREFTANDGKFYLNKKPFYMIAALDQNFYSESQYHSPSEEAIRDEMLKAKQLGLNLLRCHIKIPEKRYLELADELGLLIWYELPNWSQFNDSTKVRGRNTLEQMLDRDWNHPSLVILTIINESWGIDLKEESQRKWLSEEYDFIKSIAHGRLVVDNSACWNNFHVKTDINDYHTYYSIPENADQFKKFVTDMSGRPDWLFTKYGDSNETGKEPLVLSEFGNWGLPMLPEKLPFWFNRKFDDNDNYTPAGVYQRMNDYKYNRIFNDYSALALESQKVEFNALKYEIEQIRLQNPIQGYVITEFTDINWESNGLMDMWRNFKYGHKELANIQQADVIIPEVAKYNYYDNETINIDIFLSHYSGIDLSNSELYVYLNGSEKKKFTLGNIKTASVEKVFTFTYEIEKADNTKELQFQFVVKKDGKELAKNFIKLFVYPTVIINDKQMLFIEKSISLDKMKENLIKKYSLLNEPQKNAVLITNNIDQNIINYLKNGYNVICIVDSNSKNIEGTPFKISGRNVDNLDGNWQSNLNWVLDSEPPFSEINFGKSLGFEAKKAIPNYVIREIAKENYDDVLSGMYIGWVHFTSAFMVQMKAGEGKLILSAFKHNDNYGSDPYTAQLTDELIKYIKSSKCNPKYNWKLN